jgi:peptide/nickel transport system substrate-binding protein
LPPDPTLETPRQEWFDAPDLSTQLAAAERIQRRAFEFVPGIPLGQVTMPTAYRDNITGIVRTPYPAFWGLQKG